MCLGPYVVSSYFLLYCIGVEVQAMGHLRKCFKGQPGRNATNQTMQPKVPHETQISRGFRAKWKPFKGAERRKGCGGCARAKYQRDEVGKLRRPIELEVAILRDDAGVSACGAGSQSTSTSETTMMEAESFTRKLQTPQSTAKPLKQQASSRNQQPPFSFSALVWFFQALLTTQKTRSSPQS